MDAVDMQGVGVTEEDARDRSKWSMVATPYSQKMKKLKCLMLKQK